MKLIPNWKDAWRMDSVRVFAVIAALPVIWAQIPPETKALIPPGWMPYILGGLGVIGVVVRLRDQGLGQ
jgi:hypothetical protein